MEKAIRMAKEVHGHKEGVPSETTIAPDTILTTAKQIYDWLTA